VKVKIFYLFMALVLALSLGVMAAPLGRPVVASPDEIHVYPGPGTPLQDAIDDALEGDTILVHPGTYNENLTISKSLTLQSTDGAAVTTIQGDGTASVVNIYTPGQFVGHVVIQGFEIRGGTLQQYPGIELPRLDYGGSVAIRENLIWDNWHGIFVRAVYDGCSVTIEHNAISANVVNGINFAEDVYGTATIHENIIGAFYWWDPVEMPEPLSLPGNGSYGIYMSGVYGTATIDENIISGNGGVASDGIYIGWVGDGGSVDILDNIIGAWEFWYNEEYHQTVPGNWGDGIEVFNTAPGSRVNIEGNTISDNRYNGIDLGTPCEVRGDVTIRHNIIGAWTYYVYGEVEGEKVVIHSHRFWGNQEHGICISFITDTANVLIEENTISENGAWDSGIHISEWVRGTLTIVGNTIGAWEDEEGETYGGNAGNGIYIESLDNTVATISGNTISENTQEGIHINLVSDKSTTVMVSDNAVLDNGGAGVCFASAECGATVGICQNFIAGNETGVYLHPFVCGVDVACNIITENDNHGIWIEGDFNNITRNEISYNVGIRERSGIHLTSDADGNQIHYNNIVGNSAMLDPGIYSYGVYREEGVPVDATNNWWGDASGPGASGPGNGDWISDYVIYDPWSTEPNWMCMEGEQEPPVIEKAAASPSMISIWWDEMFPWGAEWNNYTVGPSCSTMWYVKASDVGSGVADVTIDLKDLLIDEVEVGRPPVVDGLIPADKLQKFVDQLSEEGLMAWQQRLAELEAFPLEYDPELDCWYYDEYDELSMCHLLRETIMFFADWLNWSEGQLHAVLGEIMGQELRLGEFDVEVTVSDFKGNSTIGYIPITIVDYQLPICEGWNLRSTWIALENNKWQDIVAMDDGLEADSILRWNSELKRWEQFGLGAAGYGWYYGATKVADALMKPLEAYWIHGKVNDQIGLITYRGVSAPPSRQMYAGWNLTGAALSWNQPRLMVNDALISIYEATGHCTGYTQVLSIDQYNYWQELFWVCDTEVWDSYWKWFYQETWVFTRDLSPEGPAMSQGGGYWVFMANPAVLGGFSSTPLPADFWEWWWELCIANIETTDIVQPPTGQISEPYSIDVIVHNAGTCTGRGWVSVDVRDDGGALVWSDEEYVSGLAPCDSTTVSFIWYPTEAGSYTAESGAIVCPMTVLAPPHLVVTGIQQPETIQIGEPLSVAVDVHNDGGKPGEGTVTLTIKSAGGATLVSETQPTGVLDPCDTAKVAFGPYYPDETWRGVCTVTTNPPLPGPHSITVLKPGTLNVTGIQQPATVQVGEPFAPAVDVHNGGDKPLEGAVVTLTITNAGGTVLVSETLPVPTLMGPCDTGKVPFGPWTTDETWLGVCTVTTDPPLPMAHTVTVLAPPMIEVTGIQQPAEVMVGEPLPISVDVHNSGGKPGESAVTLTITSEGGATLVNETKPTGTVDPCSTVKVAFGPYTTDETWLGVCTVTTDPPLPFAHTVTVLAPAVIEVTGIQQPATVQMEEELPISVDVHNAGDSPGTGTVTLTIKSAGGATLVNETKPTGALDPCSTVKVAFGPYYPDDTWRGVCTVTTDPPLPGPHSITVLKPGTLEVTGIQQDPTVQIGEPFIIGVDIHNAGDKSLFGAPVTLTIKSAGGATLVSETMPVPTMNPCDVGKVPFGPYIMDETWRGVCTVTTYPALPGPHTITVQKPGTLEMTGIQQPATVQLEESFSPAVDVHNSGDKTLSGASLTLTITNEGGTVLVTETLPAPTMNPCDTDKVAFGPYTTDNTWLGVCTVTIDPPLPAAHTVTVLAPAMIEVVGIQQPAEVTVGDPLDIAVDVHNAGDKPGSSTITLQIKNEAGSLVYSQPLDTPVVDPCETDKAWFYGIVTDETWVGTCTVTTIPPLPMAHTIEVVSPPPVGPGFSSKWYYDVNYALGTAAGETISALVTEAVTGGPVNITVKYTNQAGATKFAPAVTIPADSPVNTVVPIPLAMGDTGVQDIQAASKLPNTALASGMVGLVGNSSGILGGALDLKLTAAYFTDGMAFYILEDTVMTTHLLELVEVIPDMLTECSTVPIPPGPANHTDIDPSMGGLMPPTRALPGTPYSMQTMDVDAWTNPTNGTGKYTYLQAMLLGIIPLEVEVGYHTYVLTGGTNIGQPYTVGSSWTYINEQEAYAAGACSGYASMTFSCSVVASGVSVTVPKGTFADCFQITTDDPLAAGIKTDYWSPTVMGIVKTVNSETYYPGVETTVLTDYTIVTP